MCEVHEGETVQDGGGVAAVGDCSKTVSMRYVEREGKVYVYILPAPMHHSLRRWAE